MGAMTATNIVADGILRAGENTSLATLGLQWLNMWLRSVAAKHPWPYCTKWRSGIALSAGDASFLLGGGNNGVSENIIRVFDPIRYYNAAFTLRGEMRADDSLEAGTEADPLIQNTATWRGLPASFRAEMDHSGNDGIWKVHLAPIPNQALLLAVNYWFVPADVVGGNKPRYPNDETMVAAVECATLKYMSAADRGFYQRYQACQAELRDMLFRDIVTHGQAQKQHDLMQLDASTFRGK